LTTPTLTLVPHTINQSNRLESESSVLDVVVKHTGSSTKKTSLLEVNFVNVGPGAGKLLLLHGGNEEASETGRSEADFLCDDDLAVALAGEGQGAGNGGAGRGLLRRWDATEVERLQAEVLRLGAGRLEGGGVAQAAAKDVLDRNVGLRLRGDACQRVAHVDDVESVPDEVLVGADGLEGERSVGNVDVIEL